MSNVSSRYEQIDEIKKLKCINYCDWLLSLGSNSQEKVGNGVVNKSCWAKFKGRIAWFFCFSDDDERFRNKISDKPFTRNFYIILHTVLSTAGYGTAFAGQEFLNDFFDDDVTNKSNGVMGLVNVLKNTTSSHADRDSTFFIADIVFVMLIAVITFISTYLRANHCIELQDYIAVNKWGKSLPNLKYGWSKDLSATTDCKNVKRGPSLKLPCKTQIIDCCRIILSSIPAVMIIFYVTTAKENFKKHPEGGLDLAVFVANPVTWGLLLIAIAGKLPSIFADQYSKKFKDLKDTCKVIDKQNSNELEENTCELRSHVPC